MAVRGPKTRAVAVGLADMVTFAITPSDPRSTVEQLARDFRAVRDIPLALHVSVVGDTVAPFMTTPDTDPKAAGLLWPAGAPSAAAGWPRCGCVLSQGVP